MKVVVLDAETYFSDEYTLKKLTTEAYVRDPRFEVLGWGVRWADGQLEWLTHQQAIVKFAAWDWTNTLAIAHHAHFDMLILNHHYGIRPHAVSCTLSMARLVVGNHLSVGLDSLARHFGLSAKTIDYASFKGRRFSELDDSTLTSLSSGCLQDVSLTWDLFCTLANGAPSKAGRTPAFPAEEYAIVDETIRMFTEPTLVGDVDELGHVWTTEERHKRALLAELDLTAADLQSAAKFTALLAEQGVIVPNKPGKNGPIPCLAKTDEFMKGLVDDENSTIAALAAARIGVRSTGDQARAERLGFMAQRGALCVYLKYAGAHTSRWSGADAVNFQNFKRQGGIRRALCAPAGCKLIKADLSQIECRVLNLIAGQSDVVERFRNKEDVYVEIASRFYGRTITKADQAERGVGKQLELSCGYGAGADTIVRTAARGTYGPPVRLTTDEGLAARDLYRDTHPGVVNLWKEGGRLLSLLAGGVPTDWNVVRVETGKITLPNGIPMLYPQMEYHENNWRYRSRNGWTTLYGAKLVENVVQALARLIMSQTLLRIRNLGLPIKLVNLEHDAAAYLCVDKDVANVSESIAEEFRRPPTWLPTIPLDCELTVGDRYG